MVIKILRVKRKKEITNEYGKLKHKLSSHLLLEGRWYGRYGCYKVLSRTYCLQTGKMQMRSNLTNSRARLSDDIHRDHAHCSQATYDVNVNRLFHCLHSQRCVSVDNSYTNMSMPFMDYRTRWISTSQHSSQNRLRYQQSEQAHVSMSTANLCTPTVTRHSGIWKSTFQLQAASSQGSICTSATSPMQNW